uniref:Tachykinin-related peptide 8 n=1 Tax=Rhyparobia maderae TaxID=36963 RepID=TRP8_RHYMA|nr:RecName: Full=Tachykinin-related peptide 8; Short=LemTRP 8 [Rhyparobia maderae]
GPSMGFHGMR